MKVKMGIAGDPMLRHPTCETAVSRPVFLIPEYVFDATKKWNITIMLSQQLQYLCYAQMTLSFEKQRQK